MKKTIMKFAVITSAFIGVVGAFAFTPRPFGNIIYGIRQVGATVWSYTSVAPTDLSCVTQTLQQNCTISSTATVTFFNNNAKTVFPVPSSTPGAPKVTYKHAGNSIYQ